MANKRITDLVASVGLNLTDLFEIDTGGASLKLTAQQIIDLARAQVLGVTIPVLCLASASPSNSTTYYFGMDTLNSLQTVYASASIRIPKAGTLKAVFFKWSITTPGSAELVQSFIRLNDATDVSLGSTAFNAARFDIYGTGLSQAVSANDTFVYKIVTPAWVTPPLTARVAGYIYIE
jgi:hypothetical protein